MVVRQSFLKGSLEIYRAREFIYSHFPSRWESYYSPFLGHGNLFFYIKEKGANISDIDWDLINCYKVINHKCDSLIELLCNGHFINSHTRYLEISEQKQSEGFKNLPDLHRAAIYLYLNGCEKSIREYKTPLDIVENKGHESNYLNSVGLNVRPSVCNISTIENCGNYLRKYKPKYACGDYHLIDSNVKPGDFVFMNAPKYIHKKTGVFNVNDHTNLKELCDSLTKRKVKLMLVASNTKFMNSIYSKYIRIGIDGSISNRLQKSAKLILIKNYGKSK